MTARTALGARRGDPVTSIKSARQHPNAAQELVRLLPETSPLYAGRGANDVERLRGYLLASFEAVGLPDEAMPFVLEELEIGRHPYAVAGAARALRGARSVPPDAPRLLVDAIARLRGSDDVVSFEHFAPEMSLDGAVTALGELAQTLSMMGPAANEALPSLKKLVEEGGRFSPAVRAALGQALEALARTASTSCCCGPAPAPAYAAPHSPARDANSRPQLDAIELENQDGKRVLFSQAFSGRPTALAFFYTRCTNPEKCSLTVTRLARLAQCVSEKTLDANVAGISYDPRWDNPGRLRRYGTDRGMRFSTRCSLMRTVGSFTPLLESFELGVGFGPVTVNRHRLDLVVLDGELRVATRFERRLWSDETVLDALRCLSPAAA